MGRGETESWDEFALYCAFTKFTGWNVEDGGTDNDLRWFRYIMLCYGCLRLLVGFLSKVGNKFGGGTVFISGGSRVLELVVANSLYECQ